VAELPVTPETLHGRFSKDEYPVYEAFILFFVSGVVGICHFDRNKPTAVFRTYVTTSDEAFTILILENNWERWSFMAKSDNWKELDIPSRWPTSKDKRTIKTKKNEEAAKPNGDNDGQSTQATRYWGWSHQGNKRYNQL
jgi:hypothetical protein